MRCAHRGCGLRRGRIPPRNSAADYTVSGKSASVEIGVVCVPAAQVKKLLGEDLEKRGFVTFEIGLFPAGANRVDVSPDDFKLRQGKDPSFLRSAPPGLVAETIYPTRNKEPKIDGNVSVQTTEAIYSSRAGTGRMTGVAVAVGKDPNAPQPPASPSAGKNADLVLLLTESQLPEEKTLRPVAGYVFFPKPPGGKNADFELIYLGMDGQISLKLAPPKP